MATLTSQNSKSSANHIQRFEQKLTSARQAIAALPDDDFYDLLWSLIHRPGWTTLAEGAFFEAVVDSITVQAQLLSQAHQQLLNASQMVGVE
jgi:3-methyladenine DNA glycosylase/8-oxoguanine DNA glycosylase